MITSHCRICGSPKTYATLHMNECSDCSSLADKHVETLRTEKPELSESDLLYERRQALNQRAHHAHRNFVDPRAFSAGRGLFPNPPSNG